MKSPSRKKSMKEVSIMTKRIGILGGISFESTIKYYELILRTYYEKNMDYYYPEVVIFSLDFQKFTVQ